VTFEQVRCRNHFALLLLEAFPPLHFLRLASTHVFVARLGGKSFSWLLVETLTLKVGLRAIMVSSRNEEIGHTVRRAEPNFDLPH
jgi:hypothetical protein